MNCGTCKFGVGVAGGLQCRRYPPQLIVFQPRPVEHPGYHETEERWPWVGPDRDWCGEHKEKQS